MNYHKCVQIAVFVSCLTLTGHAEEIGTDPNALSTRVITLQAEVQRLEDILKTIQAQKTSSKMSAMGMMKGKAMMAEKKGMMSQMKEGMSKSSKPMGMGMKKKSSMAMTDPNKTYSSGMMGRGPRMGKMAMPSALPGFPGASHIYHIGDSGFFLDHPEHITLTTEQLAKLNTIKRAALLADNNFERQIDEAEQALWVLTSSDQPDIKEIEAKVRAIEKLNGDLRLAFIRQVGKAATVLTDQQRARLLGARAPQSEQTDSDQ